MPTVTRDQVRELLADTPADKREAVLIRMKERGYTLAEPTSAAAQSPSPMQSILSGVSDIPTNALAQAAMGPAGPQLAQGIAAVGQKVAGGLGQASDFLARKGGEMGHPTLGAAAAMIPGMAAELTPKTPAEVGLQAVAPVAGEVGGAAKELAQPALDVMRNVGRSFASRLVGVAEPFIKNATPEALRAIADTPDLVKGYILEVGRILRGGTDAAGQMVGNIEQKYLGIHSKDAEAMARIPVTDTLDNFRQGLLQRGLGIAKKAEKPIELVTEKGELLMKVFKGPQPVSKTPSITGSDADRLHYYAGELEKYKQSGASFLDLLNFRRSLAEDISWPKGSPKAYGSTANGMLQQLYKKVNQKIYKLAPELETADAISSKARKAYDKLQSQVFGAADETGSTAYDRIRRRIMQNRGTTDLLGRAAQINDAAERSMKKAIAKVSAREFEPYMRKGIWGGGLALGDAFLFGHGDFGKAAAGVGVLAATSPRMAALGIRAGSATGAAFSELSQQAQANPLIARLAMQALLQLRPTLPGTTPQPQPTAP